MSEARGGRGAGRPAFGIAARVRASILAATLAWAAAWPAAAQLGLELTPVAAPLSQPVLATHSGDGSGRLFIVELGGRILIHNGSGVLATPFLDLSSLVECCGENGLLGLAFHPAYALNGELFVSYTAPGPVSIVARYTVSTSDPNQGDPDSAEVLLSLPQPYGNHNGGAVAFGPDGYLYLAMGDGGSGGDPENRAQDLGNLFGTLLRLDVDSAPGPGLDYAIPPGNPFVGVAGARDEIWAYGLRNPWRFSFDRETGDAWIGDVGQNAVEEVDFQPAASAGGENYGWRLMEGDACFNPPTGCDDGTLTHPVLTYGHALGCSVTGGYRYRGAAHPRLEGVYLYADFCTGTVWGTVPRCDGQWTSRVVLESGLNVSSFGEDEAGELYLVHLSLANGQVHRIGVDPASAGPAIAPQPAALDFGPVPVGGSRELELTLANDGPGPEAVLVAALDPSDPARFALLPGGGAAPCGTTTPCLAPGESCTVLVRFDAIAAGAADESVEVGGNFDPVAVPLTAVAYEPCTASDQLDLSGVTVVAEETFEACHAITGGDLQIAGSGDATLVAGEWVSLDNGAAIATGGRATFEIDPLLALD